MTGRLDCRGCGAPLRDTFVDLGFSPFSNDYVALDDLRDPRTYYPLHAYVCRSCFLVQLEAHATPDRHFANYAYFSSYSTSWLEHARAFAGQMIERLHLARTSHVVELASNDGYLLRWFRDAGIPVLGVEPAANIAAHAVAEGLRTTVEFFGEELAKKLVAQGDAADLLVANNVLAHVPDLHDFVAGIACILKPDAIASIEVPHLLSLIAETQFDTIYHEHYSYFSLLALEPVFTRHGLHIVDVETLTTHGGSLRIFLSRHRPGADGERRVGAIRDAEHAAGLARLETYTSFSRAVSDRRDDFVEFLTASRRSGLRVAAYGAPAKGNTLLNYCGVRRDSIAFTVDRNPEKQHRYLPGSLIPIEPPEAIDRERPDIVVILPWNLRAEITEQLQPIRNWGGRFAVAIPHLAVF